MNKSHFLVKTAGILITVLGCGTIILKPSLVYSQNVFNTCYMITENGEFVDLSSFCGQNSSPQTVLPPQKLGDNSEATDLSEQDSPPEGDVSNNSDASPENFSPNQNPDFSEADDNYPQATDMNPLSIPRAERVIPLRRTRFQERRESSN